jgi:hypothetical protein
VTMSKPQTQLIVTQGTPLYSVQRYSSASSQSLFNMKPPFLLQVRTQTFPSSAQTASVHAAATCASKVYPEPHSSLDMTCPLSRASLTLICDTFAVIKRRVYVVKWPANETMKHHCAPVALEDPDTPAEASSPEDRWQSTESSLGLEYSYLDYIWPLCPTVDPPARASSSTSACSPLTSRRSLDDGESEAIAFEGRIQRAASTAD